MINFITFNFTKHSKDITAKTIFKFLVMSQKLFFIIIIASKNPDQQRFSLICKETLW